MGLKEEAERLKGEIEKANEAEDKVIEDAVKEEAAPEPAKEEPKPEEKKTEEEKPKEEPKPEAPKTATDYSEQRKIGKMRAELDAANARIAELARTVEKPKQEVLSPDPEPIRTDDPQAWMDWAIRQQAHRLKEIDAKQKEQDKWRADQDAERNIRDTRSQAERELSSFEASVRQAAPDYDAAKQYYINMLAGSVRVINPNITQDKLAEIVNNRILMRAGEFMNEGHDNPVQAMYEEAKRLGYRPQAASTEETSSKPDLAKVAANRSRNAGTAGASGRGEGGELTPRAAATLTNAEFAKLKPAERMRLLQSK